MSSSRRDWYDIAALLVLLLALFMVTSCATTRTSAPQVRPPPAEAWPFCARWRGAHDMLFGGVIQPDYSSPNFGCACAPKQEAEPTPQTWRGPT